MSNEKLVRADYMEAQGCQFRKFSKFEIREGGDEDAGALYVEGLAVPFNVETVLWTWNGVEYKEKFDANAFFEADMTDVIFNYNHGGKVVARTRNKTLTLSVRTDGLYTISRLDGTEEGKRLYEEVKGGYIDRMSIAFTTSEESYNTETHTRTILKIDKIYDVSAVDIPAYDTTFINARNSFTVENEKEKTAAAVNLRKEVLKTELKQILKFYGGIEK